MGTISIKKKFYRNNTRLPTHPFYFVRSAVAKRGIYLIITIEWRNNCVHDLFYVKEKYIDMEFVIVI